MVKGKILRRSKWVGAIFLLLFFVIVCRFFVLQVVDASWYQEEAERLYERESALQSDRGTIYDRYGRVLATEIPAYNVVAVLDEEAPQYVEDPQQTAQVLAPVLDMPEERLEELLSEEGRYEVQLGPGGWRVDHETAEEIEQLDLEGIHLVEESKRHYPNHSFASHVLGFVDHEQQPQMGLESMFDDRLSGQDGHIHFQVDNHGNRLPQGVEGIEQPENGDDLYLTLDERIQLFIEQALDEAQAAYEPENMAVIVSNPQTGEILGMGTRPTFDPNDYSEIESYMNNAVTSIFEPGSTFKIVTLAAAIEEGIYNGEETFESGQYDQVPGDDVIRDHQRDGWGEITFLEGVQKSSNVAFAKLGWEKMARETFYQYIYDFGFGKETGIELPGEHRGIVNPPDQAREIDVANMTFGQGISVTALQQIQAINAIANGGNLLQPYIVDRIENEAGLSEHESEPTVVQEQVVSEETAEEVKEILASVVTDGTGGSFAIDGYEVAGKTGTAQKVEDGEYVSGEYVHSFVGFAPKDDPQISVIVMVESPQVDPAGSITAQGGQVVAEIFQSVMHQSLQYFDVSPKENDIEPLEETVDHWVEMTDYEGQPIQEALEQGEEDGFAVHVLGQGDVVEEQVPGPGEEVLVQTPIYFVTDALDQVEVPDFEGWSMREVIDWAQIAQVQVEPQGRGYVIRQDREPGEMIDQSEKIEIELEPNYSD